MKLQRSIYMSILTLLTSLLFLFTGCSKFLDKKSDQSFTTPTTIQDLQMLLDDEFAINRRDAHEIVLSADNYYLNYNDWNNLIENEKNVYIWNNGGLFIEPSHNNSWGLIYFQIYRANIVLGNLTKIKRITGDQTAWNDLKGQAFFLRGKSFFQLCAIFCLSYDESTASTDLGIPLRLDEDFNKPTQRSSLKDSYTQVISDLKSSLQFLPETPIHVTRASKSAAYGLLARIYLSMRDYNSCLKYSDSCLQIKNNLMNFNGGDGIEASSSYSFSRFNPEVIYDCMIGMPNSFYYAKVDTVLYKMYSDNDLRKTMYFIDSNTLAPFKGTYSGADGNLFSGIATDEVYLMRAECNARIGNKDVAINDLNRLLETRSKNGTFTPYTASSGAEALNLVLQERRKELVFRGLRWIDLKRLNKEGGNITLMRSLNGQTFTLFPNDLRYALPIPEDVISITGIQQNPR